MYAAKVILDSISEYGHRLITFEVTLPRIVLAELNTHRDFSRNSASSRAIPISKMIDRVCTDPFIPIWWGKNQKGMQASEELSDGAKVGAIAAWLRARDRAVETVTALQGFDVHKQIANRLLEPWMWQTVIISATEWENFFNQRRHKDAQPEIKRAADMMFDARSASVPVERQSTDWHMPYISNEDVEIVSEKRFADWTDTLIKVSVGRCARVSVLAHDGKRDLSEDVKLHDKLFSAGHRSPFEHVARPMTYKEKNEMDHSVRVRTRGPISDYRCGNFSGWVQLRKTIDGESVFQG